MHKFLCVIDPLKMSNDRSEKMQKSAAESFFDNPISETFKTEASYKFGGKELDLDTIQGLDSLFSGSAVIDASNKTPPLKQGANIDLYILDEILFRFFLDLQPIELHPIRLAFIFEEAHWFLIDFYPRYKKVSMSAFVATLTQHVIRSENALAQKEKNQNGQNMKNKKQKSLKFKDANSPLNMVQGSTGQMALNYYTNLEAFQKQFNNYKHSVPVFAAIIFNDKMDHILLNRGYSKNAQFSFPRGKKSFNEVGKEAAVREVYEEIGLDVSPNILSLMFSPRKEKYNLLFVMNQNMNVPLKAQTRNEIKDISWFKISEIMKGKPELAGIRSVLLKIQDELNFIKQTRFRFNQRKILECFD